MPEGEESFKVSPLFIWWWFICLWYGKFTRMSEFDGVMYSFLLCPTLTGVVAVTLNWVFEDRVSKFIDVPSFSASYTSIAGLTLFIKLSILMSLQGVTSETVSVSLISSNWISEWRLDSILFLNSAGWATFITDTAFVTKSISSMSYPKLVLM